MSNVKEFDFKSVGTRIVDRRVNNPLANKPIGIKTPMRLGNSNDGIFAMNFSIREQIKDNLRNLILTNWGERLGLYQYGADLRPLTLELGTDAFDQELLVRINTAVSRWMPYVRLKNLTRDVDNINNTILARIRLRISYDVESLNIFDDAIEVQFFIGG